MFANTSIVLLGDFFFKDHLNVYKLSQMLKIEANSVTLKMLDLYKMPPPKRGLKQKNKYKFDDLLVFLWNQVEMKRITPIAFLKSAIVHQQVPLVYNLANESRFDLEQDIDH